jgi:hypothetical protein
MKLRSEDVKLIEGAHCTAEGITAQIAKEVNQALIDQGVDFRGLTVQLREEPGTLITLTV